MSRRLMFEDASPNQRFYATEIRENLLNDIDRLDDEDLKNIQMNYKNFGKKAVQQFIKDRDDVLFFLQFKKVKLETALVNIIMVMNREH
ncbi:hypothetical protein HMPREF2664_04325 [Staphylococcus sp. HMSC064E03]|uniref:hypothetical protein n=1 Tax=unclassified Staphylococcus TaxID=91994 RepID=UPI0008A43365|nr:MULTISPECIES: hypothetical protein [unclassified Staphylococcus]OFS55435.1 hypothetical protein HMPREF2862_07700 [Staphylococcus sp. HMSC065C09]OHQ10506.1 hypothetical protein HMPREF2664_04325 [Staphylococcus sp. HMSC064E03]